MLVVWRPDECATCVVRKVWVVARGAVLSGCSESVRTATGVRARGSGDCGGARARGRRARVTGERNASAAQVAVAVVLWWCCTHVDRHSRRRRGGRRRAQDREPVRQTITMVHAHRPTVYISYIKSRTSSSNVFNVYAARRIDRRNMRGHTLHTTADTPAVIRLHWIGKKKNAALFFLLREVAVYVY